MKDSKPVLLTFNVYPNAVGPKFNAVTQFQLSLAGMTRQQAQDLRDEVHKNPHVGVATIHMDNGCHL